MSDFGRRALAAARLDPAVFAEVERDRAASLQACALVLLASGAAAVGRVGSLAPRALAVATAMAVLGWIVWASAAFVIGGRPVPASRRPDLGGTFRVLGFAATPGIAQALAAVGALHTPVLVLAQVWMILAMTVALRHALRDRRTSRTLGVCLAGWATQLVVIVALIAVGREVIVRRPAMARSRPEAVPTVGYVGVVKPSGVAPPVE